MLCLQSVCIYSMWGMCILCHIVGKFFYSTFTNIFYCHALTLFNAWKIFKRFFYIYDGCGDCSLSLYERWSGDLWPCNWVVSVSARGHWAKLWPVYVKMGYDRERRLPRSVLPCTPYCTHFKEYRQFIQ